VPERRAPGLGARVKVCLCNDVSDRTIREHARAGATLEQILSATGAGSGCGQCLLAVARIHMAEAAVASERSARPYPSDGLAQSAA
jgi:bacterioferritin-associated ferredoxin